MFTLVKIATHRMFKVDRGQPIVYKSDLDKARPDCFDYQTPNSPVLNPWQGQLYRLASQRGQSLGRPRNLRYSSGNLPKPEGQAKGSEPSGGVDDLRVWWGKASGPRMSGVSQAAGFGHHPRIQDHWHDHR